MWYRMMLVLAAFMLAFSFPAVAEQGGAGQHGEGCDNFVPAEDGRCVHGQRAERGEGGRGDGVQGQGERGRGEGRGDPAGRGLGQGRRSQ